MNTIQNIVTFGVRMTKSSVTFFILGLIVSELTLAQDFWRPTNGPYAGSVNALMVNSIGNILAGTQTGGVFRSLNDGERWLGADGLPQNIEVAALAINSTGDIFAAIHSNGVYRSIDNGTVFTRTLNSGFIDPPPFTSLVINFDGHLFAGTYGHGVYRSIDNGNNWTLVNNGLTNNQVKGLAISDSGYVFAATFFGEGVYRSKDNGNTWVPANEGVNLTTDVNCLAINTNGDIFAGTHFGVFWSTNNGDSWTEINNGFPRNPQNQPAAIVNSIGIGPNGRVFAGTSAGVFRLNSGDFWESVNTGLASNLVNSFAFDSSDYAFIGTNGGIVFRSAESTSGAAPIVTTNSATSAIASSATLNATVNPNGLSTTVKFQYGTTTSYGTDITATPSLVTGINSVSVSAVLTGLSPNTLYHYRVVGTNSAGTTNGADQPFTTPSGSAPMSITNPATNVLATTVILNGLVNPNGLSTTIRFEYGVTTEYGNMIPATQSPVNGTTAVSVSAQLSGLQPNTQYHYRIVAMNSAGTDSSADSTFTTLANNSIFIRIETGDIVEDIGDFLGCSWGDFNGDGFLDLFVTNGNDINNTPQNNFLYYNNGNGSFRKITFGAIVTEANHSRGATWGDYNNDGALDLFVTNFPNESYLFQKQKGENLFFNKIIFSDGGDLDSPSWGDYDNDGDLDLFLANNDENFLYENNGGTLIRMRDTTIAGSIIITRDNTSMGSWADYDDDGRLDLFEVNNDTSVLHHNEGPPKYFR